MIFTCVYAFIMVVGTVWLIIKKYNKMGIVLMSLYSFVSVMAVLAVRADESLTVGMTLFPYIFLVLIYIIAFYPFLSRVNNFNVEKLNWKLNKKYLLLAYIFIFTSVISILYFLPSVKILFASGNWLENRNNLYSGQLGFSGSSIQYYSVLFSSYFRLIGIIIGFTFLRNNVRPIIGWACIVLGAMGEILSGMSISSRGSLVNTVLLIFVLYIFFYDDLQNNVRRFVVVLGSLSMCILIPYSIQVTVSRFSAGGSKSSLIDYFGHAPAVFNSQVTCINKHLFGEYAFGKIFSSKAISAESIGGLWQSRFYTFVGWLYIDWGYIGTLIIVIFISWLIMRIVVKDEYEISDLLVVFFVYYTLLQGVFVIGRSYAFSIVGTIFIYIIIKILFEKYKFVLGQIEL